VRLTKGDGADSVVRMKKITLGSTIFTLLAFGFGAAGPAGAAPDPTGETPALGRIGTFAIGTVTRNFTLPQRTRITVMGVLTGSLPKDDRKLSVRLWYPATVAAGAKRAHYLHTQQFPGKPPLAMDTAGIAVDGAPALTAARFPLVLMSHGYGGWDTYFSNLAETLASKGYVVASIDHADMPFTSVQSFQLSFGNVLLDRAQDQRQVLAALLKVAKDETTGFAAEIDTDHIGLIGYSMGGFGALATAGAPYDPESRTIKQLPKGAQSVLLSSDPVTAGQIKALVAIAPWGGQPDQRAWNADGVAKITAPVLMIDGDQDDVVNFRHGPAWIFDHLTGVDRYLLVYRDARHNVVGNPVPVDDSSDFQTLEFFTEPVWRTQRINAINQHFITAFLDLTLKGDAAKAAYLNVPTAVASDGDWPSVFGEQLGGTLAGAKQPQYWPGFQRRWAIGLEMHRAAKGSAGTIEGAGK
jgi:predicted dienelactone hydrolase